MQRFSLILALAFIGTSLAGAAITSPAEANNHRGGGHNFGHGGSGHKFGGHRFDFGHRSGHNCWQFGKWVCGPRSH